MRGPEGRGFCLFREGTYIQYHMFWRSNNQSPKQNKKTITKTKTKKDEGNAGKYVGVGRSVLIISNHIFCGVVQSNNKVGCEGRGKGWGGVKKRLAKR